MLFKIMGDSIKILFHKELLIDTNKTPKLHYQDSNIIFNKKSGHVLLKFSEDNFFVSEKQKDYDGMEGHLLWSENIFSQNVMNACVLDAIIADPTIFPEELRTNSKGHNRTILFLGTLYKSFNGRFYVRYLQFDGGRAYSDVMWLKDSYLDSCQIAIFSNILKLND